MFFAGGNQHDIPHGDDPLLFFRCDNAPSRGDDQDLLAIMGVEFVPNAFPEMDDVDHILPAVGQKHLPRDLRTRKQRSTIGFLCDFIDSDYLHRILLANIFDIRYRG